MGRQRLGRAVAAATVAEQQQQQSQRQKSRARRRRRRPEAQWMDNGVGLLPEPRARSVEVAPPLAFPSPPTNPLWPHFAAVAPHQLPSSSSASSSSASGEHSFFSPNLPRFHFALVLLSLSVISLTIICAIGCYLRILTEQRRTRRQRRQQHARNGDAAAGAAEKERLARVNKFITRPANANGTVMAAETSATVTACAAPPRPLGANAFPQRIVPQITITASGEFANVLAATPPLPLHNQPLAPLPCGAYPAATCSSTHSFQLRQPPTPCAPTPPPPLSPFNFEPMEQLKDDNNGTLEDEGGVPSGQIVPPGQHQQPQGMGRLGAEEFIRMVVARVERQEHCA